jgi:hypothetical protein
VEKLSKHLRVIVKKNGSEVVNLTMPIYSVTILDTVMPEAILPKLEQKGISLSEIMTRLKEENYAPQTLFEMDNEQKSYHVWIE